MFLIADIKLTCLYVPGGGGGMWGRGGGGVGVVGMVVVVVVVVVGGGGGGGRGTPTNCHTGCAALQRRFWKACFPKIGCDFIKFP